MLPENVRPKAIAWLCAKLPDPSRVEVDSILDRCDAAGLVSWNGGDSFELDDTSPELSRIEPRLLNQRTLIERSTNGDVAARRTLLEHDLRMAQRGIGLGRTEPPPIRELDHPSRLDRRAAINAEIDRITAGWIK